MLFNYIFAKQNNGEMVVRFEDTDQARSKKDYEKYVIEGLSWLGIKDFQSPQRQSERSHVYRSYLERLIKDGSAYVSQEQPTEASQRDEVIRLKNPGKIVKFNDLIRGEVVVDTSDLGDFVIAKSLDEPIYHFAVVIDDYEMGVTHVIRGDDHISNTPRQILIQEPIAAATPIYAHLPMVLGPDKAKLSKRHGSTTLQELIQEGYLPNAVFNYLMLLGWHPGDGQEREIFTPEELMAEFDLESVQKSGAIFSKEKLKWVNKQHLLKLSDAVFFTGIQEYLPNEIKSLPQYSDERLARLVPELRERVSVYSEIIAMAEAGELEYFFDKPGYFAQDLVWRKSDVAATTNHLKWELETLQSFSPADNWQYEYLKEAIWPYAENNGKGDVLWPLRYALSGVERSPDPISLLVILGKEESINRLIHAVEIIQKID
jgi:glutamyl-tRNA synthetase